MAYAEGSCSRCGLILPKIELRDWTEEVETERQSESVGTYASGATRYQGPRSTIRINHLKLCPDCYIRAEEQRRAEVEALAARQRAEEAEQKLLAERRRQNARKGGRILLWLLIGLVAIGLAIGALGRRNLSPHGAESDAGNVATPATSAEVKNTDTENALPTTSSATVEPTPVQQPDEANRLSDVNGLY